VFSRLLGMGGLTKTGRWERRVRWGLTIAALLAGVGYGASFGVAYSREWMEPHVPPRPLEWTRSAGLVVIGEGQVVWQAEDGNWALGGLGSSSTVFHRWKRSPGLPGVEAPHWGALPRRRVIGIPARATPLLVIGSCPLWPAPAVLGVLAAGAWARVWWRARPSRRGLCACGYPRDGLQAGAACPECGRGASGARA
jgi:hypothetical protein